MSASSQVIIHFLPKSSPGYGRRWESEPPRSTRDVAVWRPDDGVRHPGLLDSSPASHMSDCCTPKGYRQIFSEKNAIGEAKRYRSKGLDGTSRRILDSVRDGGVEGKTLLEVGGGIGADRKSVV